MLSIEPFVSKRKVGDFDCGYPTLNNYIQTLALKSTRKGYGRTYLATDETGRVVGYYALATGTVQVGDVPDAESLMPTDVPVVRLGRLAVRADCQRRGYGTQLLIHACKQTLNVADLVGVAFLEVHTLYEEARNFYVKYGFIPFLDDRMHMFLSIEAIRRLVVD
jgi:GNAT superfamily N-acetyltransferase